MKRYYMTFYNFDFVVLANNAEEARNHGVQWCKNKGLGKVYPIQLGVQRLA